MLWLRRQWFSLTDKIEIKSTLFSANKETKKSEYKGRNIEAKANGKELW